MVDLIVLSQVIRPNTTLLCLHAKFYLPASCCFTPKVLPSHSHQGGALLPGTSSSPSLLKTPQGPLLLWEKTQALYQTLCHVLPLPSPPHLWGSCTRNPGHSTLGALQHSSLCLEASSGHQAEDLPAAAFPVTLLMHAHVSLFSVSTTQPLFSPLVLFPQLPASLAQLRSQGWQPGADPTALCPCLLYPAEELLCSS